MGTFFLYTLYNVLICSMFLENVIVTDNLMRQFMEQAIPKK